jgi:hypothetical protein
VVTAAQIHGYIYGCVHILVHAQTYPGIWINKCDRLFVDSSYNAGSFGRILFGIIVLPVVLSEFSHTTSPQHKK